MPGSYMPLAAFYAASVVDRDLQDLHRPRRRARGGAAAPRGGLLYVGERELAGPQFAEGALGAVPRAAVGPLEGRARAHVDAPAVEAAAKRPAGEHHLRRSAAARETERAYLAYVEREVHEASRRRPRHAGDPHAPRARARVGPRTRVEGGAEERRARVAASVYDDDRRFDTRIARWVEIGFATGVHRHHLVRR